MKSILEDYNKFLAYFAFVVLACLVFWKLNFKIVSLVIAFIYIIYLIYKISDFLREEKDEEEKIDITTARAHGILSSNDYFYDL
ncbi:hypothetical protein G6Z11_13245, partial [Clostridium perfringens]|nr:hypothetical protein [Clostridium perfringens]